MSKSIEQRIAEISAQGITCIKNANNPYFNSKYADLGVVVEALKEPLEKAGLSYRFVTVAIGEQWILRMDVYTTGDECQKTDPYVFPLNPTNPQQMGASITYAKRYLLCTAFNVIAEEDDDGNEASGNKPTLPKKKPVPMKSTLSAEVNDEIPDFFK